MSETSLSGLATAGDDIKIWDTTSATPIHQFSPDSTSVSGKFSLVSNSWSSDTSCVASVVKGRDRIVLTYSKNKGYVSQEIQTLGIQQPTWLQFPKTTQKHVLLSSKNEVHIYDISKSKSKKSFNLKSTVTCFSVNQTDAYIAAGCQDGSISLLNLSSNQVSLPLTAPRCSGQKITGLRYSITRPSFLGTSCESGTVSFWDCNANKNLFNLSEHCAPCTGIAFSPVNEALALSCGLDKKLICHDTKAKKCVLSLSLESPLTAVDFDIDGVTMAAGTSRGKVLIYDLRSPKSALMSLAAHNSSVHSLVYKHKIDKVNVTQVMSAVKKTSQKSKMSTHRSASSLKTVKEENQKENLPRPQSVADIQQMDEVDTGGSPAISDCSVFSTRRDSMSSQLFSPLRETDISFPGSGNFNASTSHPNSRRTSEARLSTDGIFSPLKETSPNSSNTSFAPNNSNTSFATSTHRRTPFNTPPVAPPPLTMIQEESGSVPGSPLRQPLLSSGIIANASLSSAVKKLSLDKLDEFANQPVCSSSLGRGDSVGKPGLGFSSSLDDPRNANTVKPMFGSSLKGEDTRNATDVPTFNAGCVASTPAVTMQNVSKEKLSLPLTDPKPAPTLPTEAAKTSPAIHSDLHSVLTAFPQAVFDENVLSPSRQEISGAATNIADAIVTNMDPSVAAFQKSYIQSVVSEAMEEWCGGVEKRLWGLQYSLLRQLQNHQEETRLLLQEASGMNGVKEELNRLKQENKQLKQFFGRCPE